MKIDFWFGVSAALGLDAAFQDYMGLEAYIVWLRENWITLSPWWGLVAAAFAILMARLSYLRREEL